MNTGVFETGRAINKTATGDVTTGNGKLLGFYVNSTNAGTIVLRNGGSGGTVMSGTITPAIGFHRFPADIEGGLYITIGGTALDVTFFVKDA
jgi:hypothetical protein